MSTLVGQPGELTFTVSITQADTGKVEDYTLVGKVTAEEAQALGLTPTPTEKEADLGRDPLDRS